MSKSIDPNAIKALNNMKYEIASELGIGNYIEKSINDEQIKENTFFAGYVGGNMTKKLVELGEKELMKRNK